MSKLSQLARANVNALTPYQSARRIGGTGDTWLNANEAPTSEQFTLNCERLNRYPEFQPQSILAAYATYASVNTDQLITTRGADEAIELLIRTFCEPQQDKILINTPTYGMYEVSAETHGIETVKQPLTESFDPDYDAIKQQIDDVKLIFLCAPNNPTGNTLDQTALVDLLNAAKDRAIVVVDEAYIEFCPQHTQVALLKDFENLVILRTLSKAYALASIRCGFAIANPSVIELLLKVIPPYPVPEPVAQIATQALTIARISQMKARVTMLNGYRETFRQALLTLPNVEYIFPTTGNFLLVRFTDSQQVFSSLAKQGIVLRDFSNKPMLANCIRITVGSEDEMHKTLAAIKALNS